MGETKENVRKNRDIKLVTTERRKNCLVSEPNYHARKFFYRKLISNRNEKNREILMNKPIYLGLPILELSKILMYEFWYGYVKSKPDEKLCYMDTDSLVAYIKIDDI